VVMTAAIALGLAGTAGAGQATGANTTTGTTGRSSAAAGHGDASQESALAALQDGRRTIARLAEESMSPNVRNAYDRLSTSFRGLYKAYTGHTVDERESAFTAGAQGKPSEWKPAYEAVHDNLAAMIGPAANRSSETTGTTAKGGSTQANATGTAGHNPPLMSDMTQSVRDDLLALRGQLDRFERTAQPGGSTSPKH